MVHLSLNQNNIFLNYRNLSKENDKNIKILIEKKNIFFKKKFYLDLYQKIYCFCYDNCNFLLDQEEFSIWAAILTYNFYNLSVFKNYGDNKSNEP